LSNAVWFITGATRGLGAAVAAAAVRAGDHVVATGRDVGRIDLPSGDRCLALPLDITDEAAARVAVAAALERFGRIDVLVNNAGFAHLGTFESIPDADVRAQFETNVFGTMNVTRAVLPGMRAQRSGRIFIISSMAGYIGGTHYPVYAASKFALEGFAESLAAEVSPLGIFVTLVEPGFFRTDFLTTSVRYGANTIDDYRAATIANLAELEAHHHDAAGDPAKFADVLLTLSRSPAPPVRCTIGADAIAAIERTNAAVQAEIDRWRDLCSLPSDVVLDLAHE
jgi:NAD(P)-dependent dehydrogenase (short-subunit alcohol dehydrogenase family)